MKNNAQVECLYVKLAYGFAMTAIGAFYGFINNNAIVRNPMGRHCEEYKLAAIGSVKPIM